MSDDAITVTEVVLDESAVDESTVDESTSAPEPTGNFWTEPRATSAGAGWVLLVTGILGMAAAIALLLDRIQILIDPTFKPACSINPIISCGSVMVTDQGKFFGFPNPMLGLPAFAVILVTAVLVLGRVKLPRWYWLGQAAGAFLGQIFVGYLIFQSLYRIHALCPYCMVVWSVVPIILLLSISRVLPDGGRGRSMRETLWLALPLYYVVVIAMITVQFWDYWKTLF
ncbi:vitamin K epoxide reductase family protein [Gordonia sp. (in: high G+C Gram-positive bacteria)]|uniref:vitamin K epoxide reductase family protein n=1 Tax=Gordonia sp. (in: high G+C Gram-positive bacteria) TaxID=84139 RepID=UPI0016A7F2FD|nr:vitamin K epoxide reductase family protein [Gordonia sp. (in: high G+C Gram-positive bacteria)]NLG48099.1 vitamin K epoxide reductase family protein [Gordonia sp. (in: high G+C Gram-positive bacteria)]